MSNIEQAPIARTPQQDEAIKTERQFHEGRWNAMARANRDAHVIMKKEAIRDDQDFMRRNHPEFMAWQKSLRVVIENFKEKARHPENTDMRTLIIVMGGGMKCAYAAGQVMALNAMGLSADTVDAVVGASGGTLVATAFVGGSDQTRRSADMMAGPMSSTDFISPSIQRFREGTVIDLGMLEKALNDPESPYVLDEDAIRRKRTKLSYIMTLPTKGDENPTVKFLDAQNPEEVPSLSEAMNASMALHPRLTGLAGSVNGIVYRDGAIDPLPIEEIIEHFHPTDILILPQMPYEYMRSVKPSIREHLGSIIAKSFGFNTVAKGLVSRTELRESLESIQNNEHVNIGVLWPPDAGMGTITTEPNNFKAAVMASFRDTFVQFGADEPAEIPFLTQRKESANIPKNE